MTREELKAAAVAMLDRAYIPYSHFPVGAALECSDGTVFTGCNIENASFGVCRQVLREFAPNIEIICLNGAGEERTFTLEELLPHSFGPEYLQ